MSGIDRLLALMARLRDPVRGCPWDREQTFSTIAPFTIEEAFEVDDAIRRGDRDALREELGDLLLQVVFHAQMAHEEGAFGFGDVVEGLCEKLVQRHPHVFGDAVIESARAQTEAWEVMKAGERARAAAREAAKRGIDAEPASAFDGIALGLPALLRAQKLAGRARRAGIRSEGPTPLAPAAAAVAISAARAALGRFEVETPAADDDDAISRGVGTQPAIALGALLQAVVDLSEAIGADAERVLREVTAAREQALRAIERSR